MTTARGEQLAALAARVREVAQAIGDDPNDYDSGSEAWGRWQDHAEDMAAAALALADAVDPAPAGEPCPECGAGPRDRERGRCTECGYLVTPQPGSVPDPLPDPPAGPRVGIVSSSSLGEDWRPSTHLPPRAPSLGNGWPPGWYPGTD